MVDVEKLKKRKAELEAQASRTDEEMEMLRKLSEQIAELETDEEAVGVSARLPGELWERLKKRAKASGRSANAELVTLIQEAVEGTAGRPAEGTKEALQDEVKLLSDVLAAVPDFDKAEKQRLQGVLKGKLAQLYPGQAVGGRPRGTEAGKGKERLKELRAKKNGYFNPLDLNGDGLTEDERAELEELDGEARKAR